MKLNVICFEEDQGGPGLIPLNQLQLHNAPIHPHHQRWWSPTCNIGWLNVTSIPALPLTEDITDDGFNSTFQIKLWAIIVFYYGIRITIRYLHFSLYHCKFYHGTSMFAFDLSFIICMFQHQANNYKSRRYPLKLSDARMQIFQSGHNQAWPGGYFPLKVLSNMQWHWHNQMQNGPF